MRSVTKRYTVLQGLYIRTNTWELCHLLLPWCTTLETKLLSISNNLYIPEKPATVAYKRLLYPIFSRKVVIVSFDSPGILVVPWFFVVDGRQAVVGEVDEEIDSRIDLSSGSLGEIGVDGCLVGCFQK